MHNLVLSSLKEKKKKGSKFLSKDQFIVSLQQPFNNQLHSIRSTFTPFTPLHLYTFTPLLLFQLFHPSPHHKRNKTISQHYNITYNITTSQHHNKKNNKQLQINSSHSFLFLNSYKRINSLKSLFFLINLTSLYPRPYSTLPSTQHPLLTYKDNTLSRNPYFFLSTFRDP
ncbi:hypothetical protein EYC80_002020 [Monilinia laxa]|uniref:Uncharacterized protein n=1 Tax=Monilinia laxa TaxID=61186 RepID=A0A5N6K6Y7_MONLA|nr:hypothetical protein EYC80_002020 [Monilinia laxa]